MIVLTDLNTKCLVFVNPNSICFIRHAYKGCEICFENNSIFVEETNLDVNDHISAYERKKNESF
jgi:uncharacterized protein YlzI (FlbEa/FlbD family)